MAEYNRNNEILRYSPYSSAAWTLFFGVNNFGLTVHENILRQSQELTRLMKQNTSSHGRESLTFSNVPYSVGHVLVHFLFTGRYQYLHSVHPLGDTPARRDITELTTAFKVHSTAQSWLLPALSALAAEEIIRLGEKLSLPGFIRMLEKADPAAISIPKVSTYLRDRIVSSCTSLTPATAKTVRAEIGTPNSASQFILKCMIEMMEMKQPPEPASPADMPEEESPPEDGPEVPPHTPDQSVLGDVLAPGKKKKEDDPIPQCVLEPESEPEPAPTVISYWTVAAEEAAAEEAAAKEAAEAEAAALIEAEEAELVHLERKKATKGRLTKTNAARLLVLTENAAKRAHERAAKEAEEAAEKEALEQAAREAEEAAAAAAEEEAAQEARPTE